MSGCPAAAGLWPHYSASLSLSFFTHKTGVTVASILLICTHSAWHREGPQGATRPSLTPSLANCAKLIKCNPTPWASLGATSMLSVEHTLRTTDGALPSANPWEREALKQRRQGSRPWGLLRHLSKSGEQSRGHTWRSSCHKQVAVSTSLSP